MKKYVCALGIIALIAACQQGEQSGSSGSDLDGFTVYGHIAGLDAGGIVIFHNEGDGSYILDSVGVIKNTFVYLERSYRLEPGVRSQRMEKHRS